MSTAGIIKTSCLILKGPACLPLANVANVIPSGVACCITHSDRVTTHPSHLNTPALAVGFKGSR